MKSCSRTDHARVDPARSLVCTPGRRRCGDRPQDPRGEARLETKPRTGVAVVESHRPRKWASIRPPSRGSEAASAGSRAHGLQPHRIEYFKLSSRGPRPDDSSLALVAREKLRDVVGAPALVAADHAGPEPLGSDEQRSIPRAPGLAFERRARSKPSTAPSQCLPLKKRAFVCVARTTHWKLPSGSEPESTP